MAKKRVAFHFAGKTDRKSKKAAKIEFKTSSEECMSSWSKQAAICAVEAKNRNQLISCRGK